MANFNVIYWVIIITKNSKFILFIGVIEYYYC